MPIHHAVLGLLAQGPSYGYELKGSFEEAIGAPWGALNIGHLYQVLDRLVRDGLATGRPVRQRDRPDKIVYKLTDAGRAELENWLAAPVEPKGGYRDDFFLKLFVASRLGADHLLRSIHLQRESYLGELRALEELKNRYRSDELVSLLIEAAALHTKANLRLVELAEERVPQLADAAKKSEGSVADEGRASGTGSASSN